MGTKQGSALIIAILLTAIIATAGFGLARLVLIELDGGAVQASNLKAYYLAEGGIEEGLLRWRYDHKAELLAGSRKVGSDGKDGRLWQMSNLTNPSNNQPNVSGSDFSGLLLASNGDRVATTIYNRVLDTTGGRDLGQIKTNVFNTGLSPGGSNLTAMSPLDDYVNNRPDLYIKKDNKIIFGLEGNDQADDITLAWRFEGVGMSSADKPWSSIGANNKVGIEVRLFKNSENGNPAVIAKKIYSPSNHLITGAGDGLACLDSGQLCYIQNLKADLSNFAVTGDTYVTITPIGANIVLGAWGLRILPSGSSSGPANQPAEIVDSVSHIESVGLSGGRMKGLEVKVDQNSGRILGLFDFVLFQGGK